MLHEIYPKIVLYLKASAIVLVAYFAPLESTLALTGSLVIADLLTGIAASIKAKKRITSSRFSHTINKTCVFLVTICTAYVVQSIVPDQPILKVVTGLIAIREALSVLENLNILSNDNILTSIIDKLKTDNDKHE